MNKWKLIFDLRNVKVLLLTQLGIYVLLFTLIFATRKFITSEFVEPYYIYSNFYFFVDFILPIVMMSTILVLFSEDFGKKSSEFVNSLPVSKFHFLIVRYFRMALFTFIPYITLLYFFNLKANNAMGKNVSFVRLLELTTPTALFLMALALFIVVLMRKTFYSFIICGSYLLLDASFTGNFFDGKTLFISMYIQNFSQKQISDNRILFFTLSLIFIVLAYIIFRSKAYSNIINIRNLE